MEKKIDEHIFQGMQRDSSISKQPSQFLWDAENIRLTAKEGDTLLSVTNEKGVLESLDTQGKPICLEGIYVGHCVLGNYLTVFTHIPMTENTPARDCIYRVEKTFSGYLVRQLYGKEGQENLGFSIDHPLQTLGVFENEKIQKVYWVDGINQPRVINICKSLLSPNAEDAYISTSFDFVPEMKLKDSIKVRKISDSTGMFPAGVIQYAVSYYNKYGQQSNISCVSPLIPTSFKNRAGSPEEKVGNSFRVTVTNPDTTFEYLRLYSIFRSSLDGTPICKRVADVKIGDGGNSGGSYYELAIKGDVETFNYYKLNGSADSPCPFQIRTAVGKEEFTSITESGVPEITGKVSSAIDSGNFYVINKADYPYAILKFTDNNLDKYVVWGDATTMYVCKTPTTGALGYGFYVTMVNESNNTVKIQVITPSSSEDAPYYKERSAVEGITITDNWSIGDTIDNQELLYVGGDSITADTLEAKDGTLFLGNIHYSQVQLEDRKDEIKEVFYNEGTDTITPWNKEYFVPLSLNGNIYKWGSTLNAVDKGGYYINPTHFKRGEHYRFGVQFQYKTGKWSEPIFITDKTVDYTPSGNSNLSISIDSNQISYSVPCFKATVPAGLAKTLYDIGYRRVRGVVVYPNTQDRLILAQGVMNPTVQSVGLSNTHTPDYQSSWFFRPKGDANHNDVWIFEGACVANDNGAQLLTKTNRGAEIQGVPEGVSTINNNDEPANQKKSVFTVAHMVQTIHSPEFEFDDSTANLELDSYNTQYIGNVKFIGNVGDIDIQTSSGPIGKSSSGFCKQMLTYTFNDVQANRNIPRKLCAGLFYRDWLTDDDHGNEKYRQYPNEKDEVGFMIYPWQKSGSLNNDCNRPDGTGTRSAVLKKKIISNLGFTTTNFGTVSAFTHGYISLFNSDQMELCKLGQLTYYGNVDTLLNPIQDFGVIAAVKNESGEGNGELTSTGGFTSINLAEATSEGIAGNTDIGDRNPSLRVQTENIRMKYKSTPHCVLGTQSITVGDCQLPIVELFRDENTATDFGGDSEEAKQSNIWLPAGEAVELDVSEDNDGTLFYYTYGDTWYQRYDCLKTYAFTPEDENQIVEIGSFMLETHVNIDGRYDKNRGLDSNLYMSPQNFNLVNPVYSQKDNFFSYKILDSDFYTLNDFPATINWTLMKNNASDVDIWTTINMGSSLDVDGTLGPVTSINASNDILYCFQERGVSQIMFNSRVQIPTSDNVPIEISNNYKVDGNKYISNSIGCYNKFAIASSPNGIYFIDGVSKSLYLLQGQQLANISSTHGFDYWFSEQDSQSKWVPTRTDFITHKVVTYNMKFWKQLGLLLTYDKTNRDLYIITPDRTLCYSEKLQQFVSFMSYNNVSGMLNMDSTFHALYTWYNGRQGYWVQLYNMFEGKYNNFFTGVHPSSITFVSNADVLLDKLFTNLESRVDFYDQDGNLQHDVFFDTLRVWNEYQDTDYDDYITFGARYKEERTTILNHKTFPYSSAGVGSNVKKKFRIWRVDIPRSSKKKEIMVGGVMQTVRVKSNDRIRNTWCKIKLEMNKVSDPNNTLGMEMHDIGVIYYV